MIILVVIINPGQGGQPKAYRRLEVDNFSSPSLGEAWLSWSLRCLSPTPTVHTARGWSGLKGSSFIRSKKDAKRAQWQQDSITLFWENTRKHQKTMSDSVNNWFTNASSTWPALVMGMSWLFAAVCQGKSPKGPRNRALARFVTPSQSQRENQQKHCKHVRLAVSRLNTPLFFLVNNGTY